MRLCFPYLYALPSTLSFQVWAKEKEAWRGVPEGSSLKVGLPWAAWGATY